jgi:hypothetical protein
VIKRCAGILTFRHNRLVPTTPSEASPPALETPATPRNESRAQTPPNTQTRPKLRITIPLPNQQDRNRYVGSCSSSCTCTNTPESDYPWRRAQKRVIHDKHGHLAAGRRWEQTLRERAYQRTTRARALFSAGVAPCDISEIMRRQDLGLDGPESETGSEGQDDRVQDQGRKPLGRLRGYSNQVFKVIIASPGKIIKKCAWILNIRKDQPIVVEVAELGSMLDSPSESDPSQSQSQARSTSNSPIPEQPFDNLDSRVRNEIREWERKTRVIPLKRAPSSFEDEYICHGPGRAIWLERCRQAAEERAKFPPKWDGDPPAPGPRPPPFRPEDWFPTIPLTERNPPPRDRRSNIEKFLGDVIGLPI